MKRIVGLWGIVVAMVVVGLSVGRPLAPVAAAPVSNGYRANSPEYGMSVFIFGKPGTTGRDLEKLQAVNFGWQKSLFRWRDIEGACKGCFYWGESDRVVRASANAGRRSSPVSTSSRIRRGPMARTTAHRTTIRITPTL